MSIEAEKSYSGVSFLTNPVTSTSFFTPEDMTDEQKMMRDAAAAFVEKEVFPRVEAIEAKEEGVVRELLRMAGDQGLLMIDVPEAYGGADLGIIVSMIVAMQQRESSFAAAFGAHVGIGTLPIVFYGTEEQKQKYLPKLTSGEWAASYALTEPGVGSDAMNISTRASLSEDGKYYILNGTKQWITNAGFADVMVVFAKVDDTKHSAFIVETSWPGLSLGAEEKKMGIKGSSTRSVYFDNVKVPVENVLGEIGKGYKIAFNILNIGRLKLGAGSVGGCIAALQMATKYAGERKAFGKNLHDFGMIKKKLARMAADTYALESLVFRTSDMMEESRKSAGADSVASLQALEEFAVEASIAKVYGSEIVSQDIDEAVQIFGGYGFMQEYPIEKAYRDARILRIFEGTNEVNRLVIAGTLFKRVMQGKIDLFGIFGEVDQAMTSGELTAFAADDTPEDLKEAVNHLERAKRAAIYSAMKASMKFMAQMEEEQEFLEYAANVLIGLFAADSALGRALMAAKRSDEKVHVHTLLAQLSTWRLLMDIKQTLECALGSAFQGDELKEELTKVRSYVGDYELNAIEVQREIAGIVVDCAGYPLSK